MGWRERFGGDDERAQIAARARELLAAAGTRPSAGESSSWGSGVDGAATEHPLPPPRGGWVPPAFADDGPEAGSAPGGGRGRHAVDHHGGDVDPPPFPVLAPIELDPERVATKGGPRSWRERVRFDPGRRGLVAVAAVVVVVGSIAGGVVFRGGQSSAVTVAAASGAPAPSDAPAAPLAGGTSGSGGPASGAAAGGAATGSGSASPSSSSAGTVTVDVAGLVVHPGVYTLPAGSRVEDALDAAGGAQPGADLTTLNRARVLVDGEQLAVGVPGAPGGAAPGGAAPAGSGSAAGGSGTPGPGAAAGGPVDLNTAGLEQLDTLPGVGPVLAQAILDWRTDHGRFSSVDDLQQVSGIGPSRFATLKDLVTV